ncbi:hypothetical protein RYH73_03450 [Olivibacter sp. CPCC 100613]|uniref:hypothetical protein n=1 Tax=Olivibacter sp. CPCC 100613 TaxID=3079931 RepID=UPI002FFB8060
MKEKKESPNQQSGQNTFSGTGQDKYTKNNGSKENIKRIQRLKIVKALNAASIPLNMRQLESITGVERSTICWRISELKKSDTVFIAYYSSCPITKYSPVGFYWLRSRGCSWLNGPSRNIGGEYAGN